MGSNVQIHSSPFLFLTYYLYSVDFIAAPSLKYPLLIKINLMKIKKSKIS